MQKIYIKLYNNRDIKYKEFTSSLIPNIDKKNIIGVRIPVIRKMAKDMYKSNDYQSFIDDLPHKYLEENILHSCILSLYDDIDDLIIELDKYLPFVDNWSVCDTIKPKIFKTNLEKVYNKIKEWVVSNETYKIRYGIVALLNYYLDEGFSEEYNNLVLSIKSEDYYVNMAIAWYFSFALIKQYKITIKIFENKYLDKWVHNKAIQKAIESYRIDSETKEYLKSLKIK